MGVGDGGVVEISHDNDGPAFQLVEKLRERIGLMGAFVAGIGNFPEKTEAAFHGVGGLGIAHEEVVVGAVLFAQVHGLQMHVDDDHGVASGRQHPEGGGTVGLGTEEEPALGDGETREQPHCALAHLLLAVVVAATAHGAHQGVLIGCGFIRGLLQTCQVRLLGTDVLHDDEIAPFVGFPVREGADIVRHHFETTFGRGGAEVDGEVVAQGSATAQQADSGNPCQTGLDKQAYHAHSYHSGHTEGEAQTEEARNAPPFRRIGIRTGGTGPKEQYG